MKKLVLFICLGLMHSAFAQKGDELLVYSLKGNVSVIENNKESKLKIGKVLRPGCSIKTQANAKLTMVCKEGKPLTLTKQGIFPVTRWKDSCSTGSKSVSSNYFQYIWDQLYVRSDEYKREHIEATASVVRGEPTEPGNDSLEMKLYLALDTVCYSSGNFLLSWLPGNDYKGKYYFKLVDVNDNRKVYDDSIRGNTLPLQKLKKQMKPGHYYAWETSAKQTGWVAGGTINYLSPQTVKNRILTIQNDIVVPEDLAARHFRTAFLLEQEHFLADAFIYYQKAAKAGPGIKLYSDKLGEFKKQFQLSKY